MIIRKQEAATGKSARISTQVRSGILIRGRPPVTGPITMIPWAEKLNAALAATAPITAKSGPGNRGARWRKTRMTATTVADTESVGTCTCGKLRSTWASCSTVLREATGIPNISPSTAMPTWHPTPVRNPTSTVCDRKSARKPSLNKRANSRPPAVNSATSPANSTYFWLARGAMCSKPPARIAAVAESAATTRYREEPNAANATSGKSRV
jgi:hypothetical protein